MGVDLSIIIEYHTKANFSTDVLRFDRDRALFDEIMKISKSKGVTDDTFVCYSPDGKYSFTTEQDDYGENLKFVKAKDFKTIDVNKINLSQKNKAILNFIRSINENIKIFLYWS